MSERIERALCFCGKIQAEARGEPFWVCSDHDDDCRRAIGSPLNVWIGYRPEQVSFNSGQPKAFSRTPGVTRTFCADCGTSIGYTDAGLADELYLTIGFMEHPERFFPQAHAYWSMRLPWVEFPDSLPRIEGVSRTRNPDFGNPADRRQ